MYKLLRGNEATDTRTYDLHSIYQPRMNFFMLTLYDKFWFAEHKIACIYLIDIIWDETDPCVGVSGTITVTHSSIGQ